MKDKRCEMVCPICRVLRKSIEHLRLDPEHAILHKKPLHEQEQRQWNISPTVFRLLTSHQSAQLASQCPSLSCWWSSVTKESRWTCQLEKKQFFNGKENCFLGGRIGKDNLLCEIRSAFKGGFLGGAVVKHPLCSARDTDSIPGLGKFHIPWTQLGPCTTTTGPALWSLCVTTRKPLQRPVHCKHRVAHVHN